MAEQIAGTKHDAFEKNTDRLRVSSQTVSRYTDLRVEWLLECRLQPYHVKVGKCQVKSPKVYIRDSGPRHALLGHPVVGASWEGFDRNRSKLPHPKGGYSALLIGM